MPVNMTGLLFALPMTQMTRRLSKEGRLHEDFDVLPGGDDQFTAGLNFDPCRPHARGDCEREDESISSGGAATRCAVWRSARGRCRDGWRTIPLGLSPCFVHHRTRTG